MTNRAEKAVFKNNLLHLTLAEARHGLEEKKFSAVELTKAYLNSMEQHRHLNAYILETREQALDQAKESDARLAKGEGRPLEGIPLAIKDLFCTKDVQTTAGSHILEGFTPPYESTVSENLKVAGSVILGKTNMDEFAMGSANITSYFGNVVNPWKRKDGKDLTPGGSSGGTAAAVAGGLALAGTGTDTGGSIRQPASFSGVVGLKPTYGRCSRWGIVAFASSLDQAGPLTRDVRDAALMLKVMAGHDLKDSTSAQVEVPNFEKALDLGVGGLRVGIPKEYRLEGMSEDIMKLWERGKTWLKEAGAEIVDISLPHTKYSLPTYYVLAPAEASSNLARYDGVRYGLRVPGKTLDELYENTRSEGFGEEVRRRIMIGTYVLSAGYYDAYYLKAQKVRRLITQDFELAFQKVDVILTPTTPSAAFALDEKPTDPVVMYLNDVLTVPANLAGLPGISLPAGLSSEGLPLGLQLIGPAFDENVLFRTARILEEAAQFKSFLEGQVS
ncbi:MAG: aspartyl/glutamyl-tRNA amidotransferase subunit A [Alphaproteobacteria bacterium GWC2_42_16]|nr:MAG: aspartyl/glutamyl-tRNA amidotransferase subunit A [Alphaproteobacteria bacterium GWC2_42_16]OFW73088.1 MAG: aspartyl/glutamyl-tRNA amidotransferase subunit A [Alphaproteobacteria bacterium GWA2_41_27]OFW81662.1 MAG: aspartyl/glutamyl-tRNA amidotransferase subunit A [Alphaproteobacteria bacterium RIFCSPHIGHO2_12_FULL_42_100]OFW85304.1 MAG: aspartyl/glutamyl-tRNA amidotransferase subunit A [Alphaproteobacteria bacterium RBG_16_42_14]OFW90562.1 MAG: aspartyl/glutamyl-tRNA amidotransferase 